MYHYIRVGVLVLVVPDLVVCRIDRQVEDVYDVVGCAVDAHSGVLRVVVRRRVAVFVVCEGREGDARDVEGIVQVLVAWLRALVLFILVVCVLAGLCRVRVSLAVCRVLEVGTRDGAAVIDLRQAARYAVLVLVTCAYQGFKRFEAAYCVRHVVDGRDVFVPRFFCPVYAEVNAVLVDDRRVDVCRF